jgi:predicted nucleic acid-binding protein
MIINSKKYCLDANVLIQAWQKYYSPKFCPDYWSVLTELGLRDRIFLSEEVFQEITRTDDELSDWLRNSQIPISKTDGNVINCWKKILNAHPKHQFLVDNTKQRSLADPWLISHALNQNAIVVTKEEKVMNPTTNRIKIPNVCDNMGILWRTDFQFIEELNIKFTCNLK